MKKFFSKIVSFLSMLFSNLDQWIHEHIQPSIETLERLKACVDSPLCDVLTALIPGDLDDNIKSWVRANLEKAITDLKIAKEIDELPTWEEKIKRLVEILANLSPEVRKGLYLRLASLMAINSGGREKVKGHSVDLLVQMQYSKMVEGLQHSDLPASKYTAADPVDQPKHWNPLTLQYE